MSQEAEHGSEPESSSTNAPNEPVYIEYTGQGEPPTRQGLFLPPPSPPPYPAGVFPPPFYNRGPLPPPIPPYPYPGMGGRGYEGPPAHPLSLQEGLRQLPYQWWKLVWKPSIGKFVEEKGKASWSVVLVTLLIYAVVYAIFMLAQTYIPGSLFNLTSQISHYNTSYTAPSTAGIAELNRTILQVEQLGSCVIVLISVFIGEGTYFLLAKLFKGSGTFLQQIYANMLYTIPTQIILVILFTLPFVGGVLGYVLSTFIGVYFYVLRIFSTQAVHRLSIGKALGVVFIPVALGIILGFVLVFVIVFTVLMAFNALHTP